MAKAGGTGVRIRNAALGGAGLLSGVVLTALEASEFAAANAPERAVLLALIVINLAAFAGLASRSRLATLRLGAGPLRAAHWLANIAFSGVCALLLIHAADPRRAALFGALALMFALWAAAVRRISRPWIL